VLHQGMVQGRAGGALGGARRILVRARRRGVRWGAARDPLARRRGAVARPVPWRARRPGRSQGGASRIRLGSPEEYFVQQWSTVVRPMPTTFGKPVKGTSQGVRPLTGAPRMQAAWVSSRAPWATVCASGRVAVHADSLTPVHMHPCKRARLGTNGDMRGLELGHTVQGAGCPRFNCSLLPTSSDCTTHAARMRRTQECTLAMAVACI